MTHKVLFVIGLIFMLTGQILRAQGNDFVYNQQPIDFAHWFLLVGVVCLIPQVVSFPKSIFSTLGVPLTLIGITCMIGMYVVDFILWSYPTEELRSEFEKHLTQVPSVWKTFVSIGPSAKIFNLGLLILSLNYFKNKKIGVGILIVATLIFWRILPIPFRLVFGYALTLIGFAVILFGKDTKSSTVQSE